MAIDIPPEVTFLFPCLNEAETVAQCIAEARAQLDSHGIRAEIVVADNGSNDGSPKIAASAGARVVEVAEIYPEVRNRGYGTGLSAGIRSARGKYVIFADSDGSYDLSNLAAFIDRLRQGFDLVMGNRFRGGIEPGAMPTLHKVFGNPAMTFLGRLFFGADIGDVNCGIRGCNREAILKLGLNSTGMEFATEMVAKAYLAKLKITEVPTILRPDGRSRKPHLRTFADGFRQLRFMLLYSPRWLLLYPGLLLFLSGSALMTAIVIQPINIFGAILDVHSILVSMAAVVGGSQIVLSFLLSYQYATGQGVLPTSPRFEVFLRQKSLRRAITIGGLFFLTGCGGIVSSVLVWADSSFGGLDIHKMMRLLIPSVTAVIVGMQLVTAGFVSSVLDLRSNVHDT